jgi:hypothetical protein
MAIQDDIHSKLIEQVLIMVAEALHLLVVCEVGVVDGAATNNRK